jgi:hypothetical protein
MERQMAQCAGKRSTGDILGQLDHDLQQES